MINLTVVIDNDEALKKLKELQKVAKQSTSSVVSDAERMDSAFNSVKGSIAELAGAAALGGFVNKVIQVRGEVQQLEVAFETMLGSKAKAEALMADVINLAAKTPFGLQDVSNATKMLLAYGSTAESVADEIKMLGNIASGLSIPLNDMIYLYGTTRTQGRMFTQDLRQFMGRGIPLAEELAKQFGVTKDEVGALVTDGKVGFAEMQKALQSMTSDGGKFFNLMDKQSQTIAGQISNLEDSIYQMFNAIGESQQGTISKGISMVSSLVENYEKVIDVISHLIIVYGAYKAAVMAVAAAQSVASMLKMVKTLYDVAKGAQTAAAAFSLLSGTTKGWVGLATGVISAIGILMMDFSQKTEKATETMGELEQAAHDEYIEVNKLVFRLQDVNTSENERREILEKLRSINPDIVDGIDAESIAFGKLTSNLKNYNDEQVKRVQLAAINDRMTTAADRKGKAELELADAKLALKEDVDAIVAEYLTSGKLPSIVFDQKLGYAGSKKAQDEAKKQIEAKLEDAVRSRAQNLITDEDFAKILATLAEGVTITDPTAGGKRDFSSSFEYDVQGIKEVGALKTIRAAEKEVEAANKDLEKATEQSQYLLSTFGFLNEDNPNEGGEEVQYLEAKRAAYKAWVTELQKLQAIERGEIEATEEAWKTQKQNEENARKAYEALGGVTRKTTPEIIDAGDDFLAEADKDAAKATENLEAEIAKRAKTWDEYLIQFGTFRERWAATERKYDREISEAETEGERKALEAERDAALAAFQVQAGEWAKDLVNKSQEEINRLLEELQAQVDAKQAAFDALDSSDSQEAKDYQKTINELNAQIAHLKTLVKDAGEEVKEDNWADATQVFQNIGSSATDAADGIAEFDEWLADALRGIAQLASSATNMIGAIQGVMAAFKEGVSGIEKASAILAVVGAAIQLVSVIAKAFNGGEEAAKAATLAALEYARALEKISNIELREAFSNYFGSDDFSRFTALLGKTREQLQEIDAITKELDQNWIGGTGVDYSASLDAYSANRQAQAALIKKANGAEIQLVADMRSGWQKFWGKGYQNVDVKDLKDFYDEDGNLNVDMLKAYYDNYAEYLDAGQKELIESLIITGEEYAANLAEINSYMQDIFGDLGASITDSLVDAFRNGTDAAEAMGDAVGNVVEQIATDMAYADFIQPLLDQAQDAIEDLNKERSEGGMSDEEYMRQLMGITSTLLGNAQAAGEGMSVYLDTMRQMAKEMGIDIFESDSAKNSTYAKGFQAMSQETGSELNGRFTDIQGQTHRIAEAVEFIKSLNASQLQQTISISETVAHIRTDTIRIAENTSVLTQMAADISSIKSDISNGGY